MVESKLLAQEIPERLGRSRCTTSKCFRQQENGRTVSAVEVFVLESYKGGRPAAYIHAVDTLPAFCRRGYATQLLRQATEWARQQGCYKVFVVCHDELVPFYEQAGFERVGAYMKRQLVD